MEKTLRSFPHGDGLNSLCPVFAFNKLLPSSLVRTSGSQPDNPGSNPGDRTNQPHKIFNKKKKKNHFSKLLLLLNKQIWEKTKENPHALTSGGQYSIRFHNGPRSNLHTKHHLPKLQIPSASLLKLLQHLRHTTAATNLA